MSSLSSLSRTLHCCCPRCTCCHWFVSLSILIVVITLGIAVVNVVGEGLILVVVGNRLVVFVIALGDFIVVGNFALFGILQVPSISLFLMGHILVH
jgi:hypothetical protein